MLDDLFFLFADFPLVNQQGLSLVGDVDVVTLLVVVSERDRLVVDLDVLRNWLGEVDVGHFVDSVVAVISNDGLADDFVLDFTLFPAFFLEIIDVVEHGVLLEASGDKVDLKEEAFLVEVYGGKEPLYDGNVGLLHHASLVFHHVIKFRISSDFDHI